MKLSIFLGDIADAPAEAVCTSTNPGLSLMMGTGASIRRRGGPEVMRACEALIGGRKSLPPGTAHPTTAGLLPNKVAIHCIASDAAHRSSEAIVRSCVVSALGCAQALGCSSIAMPVFGTGHARLPFATAASAMARSATETPPGVEHLIFVTNDEENVAPLRAVLESATGQPVEIERSQEDEPEAASYWAFSLDVD
jgi:O-acetyl-ADP-ribose deacetylase (regulator of RNase III)